MKNILPILLAVAIAGCILFGVAFIATQSNLSNTKAVLADTQTQLTDTQTELASTANELVNTTDALDTVKTDLQTANDDLAAAQKDLDAKTTELATTTVKLNSVTTERDVARAQNVVFVTDYSSLRDQINMRAGEGTDSETFITPNDPDVILETLYAAGVFSSDATERWADYLRLYQWVVNNIEYSYDTSIPWMPQDITGSISWFGDFWKLPSETISDGHGDCEDMANLLTSMILSYTAEKYDCWSIIIQNDDSGHVATAIPVAGDQLSILDPAGNYYTGRDFGSIRSYSIATTISSWLNYWSADMPGARVKAVFSHNFYREFTSTQEFIQWAKDRYPD